MKVLFPGRILFSDEGHIELQRKDHKLEMSGGWDQSSKSYFC